MAGDAPQQQQQLAAVTGTAHSKHPPATARHRAGGERTNSL